MLIWCIAFFCGTLFCTQDNQQIFTTIYQNKVWGDSASVSGVGSNLEQTKVLREELPQILKTFNIKSMLDAPCGDCYWITKISLPLEVYIGIDIVEGIIAKNKELFEDENHTYYHLDLIHDPLPKVDLVLCRDCLVHFTFEQIKLALKNLKNSGATYLLLTTFSGKRRNYNIKMGDWRPLNFQLPPFNFPEPIMEINENNTQYNKRFNDKSLGLWKIEDLPI